MSGPRVVPDAIVPMPLFPDRMARVIALERHSDRCVRGEDCTRPGDPMVLVEPLANAERGWLHLSQIDEAIAEMMLGGDGEGGAS